MNQIFSPECGPENNPGTTLMLRLEGELDLAAAPRIHLELETLFAAGATSIAIDLLDATFLDSTALGVLVVASNRCKDMGGRLHLIVVEPQILRVLDITGLTDLFLLHQGHNELAPLEPEI